MVRGGRGYGSRSSYRGSSNRGNSSWNGSASRGHYSGYSDSRSKYDRFSSRDDYHKSYKTESSYLSREGRRSPERKRPRTEAPSSRHDYYGSYGSSRHEPPSYSERRGYSGDRHTSTPFSRREEYRRSSGPPSRGSYRGRISSRGSRGLKGRERAGRRRLIDSSYTIRRRTIPRSSAWRAKVSRMRSAIVRKYAAKRRADENDESKDEKKVKKDEENQDEKTEKADKDSKDGSKDEKAEDAEGKTPQKKSFIKLQCPHCNIKSVTFQNYEMHFRSKTHIVAMRKIASKQKSILTQMRQAQRNTQNELEKTSDELTDRTNYCPLCKLNFKQKRAVHQLSEAHQNMKKFLIPQCKICNIVFKSPMGYEIHCCSIKHIKRQQRMENDDGSGDDDLENFTTIDSVGEGDGTEDAEGKETVNVGIEKIRKIEAHYCDLCKMYLPRAEENELSEILSRHCSQKVHRKRYLRLQDSEKKNEIKTEETDTKQDGDEQTNEADPKADDNLDKDDKLWADVDKDLGDILAEAQSGNKSSDEDEEDSHVNGERYDRFKLSILNDGEGAAPEKAEN